MDCCHCKATATQNIGTLGPLCEACFCATIEKRFRKEIAAQGGLPHQGIVRVQTDNSLCALVAERILRDMIRPPLTLADSKTDDGRADIIIDPRPLDNEAENAMREALENTNSPQTSTLAPLRSTSITEIAAYASIKGIHGELPKKSPLASALDDFEKRYPGSKSGLAQWRKAAEILRAKSSNA